MSKALKLLTVMIVGVMVVVAAWAVAGSGQADQAGSGDDPGFIQVIGEAEVAARPDRARITLGVETTEGTVAGAVRGNAELMDRTIAALNEQGVSQDQVSTGSYRVSSFQEPVRDSEQARETKYRAVNGITVIVDELQMVGSLIDVAVQAGANQVRSVQFEVKNTDELKIAALEQATIQARSRADAIARAAGTRITGIMSITEDALGYTPIRMQEDAAVFGLGVETPVLPGDVKVAARVVVKYYMR